MVTNNMLTGNTQYVQHGNTHIGTHFKSIHILNPYMVTNNMFNVYCIGRLCMVTHMLSSLTWEDNSKEIYLNAKHAKCKTYEQFSLQAA